MKKKLFKNFRMLPFACIIMVTTFWACSSATDEDMDLIPVEAVLEEGMIKLMNGIGDWDANVIYEKDGYVFFKENHEAIDNLYLQFMSPKNDYNCCILADKSDYLPEVLHFSDETYYFENLGDTIVVSLSTEEKYEVLDSIPFEISYSNSYSKAVGTFTTITYLNRDDKIQKVVRALDAILEAGESYTSSQVKRLKRALDNISMFYYYENVEEIINELDLCRQEYGEKGDSVIYCFSQYATKVKIKEFDPAIYGVTTKTRMGAEVSCNSAIVSGRIFCPNRQVSEKGKWGIIYAKDREDLNFESENAHIVYATEKDFVVELRNLDLNTTYYFATFYKFNSRDHGGLYHRYGPKDAEYYVDSWPNSFKTVEPIVEIASISNSDPVVFDEGRYYNPITGEYGDYYVFCCILPKIKMNLKGIKYVLGYSYEFQNPVPFHYSYVNGPFLFDEERLIDGCVNPIYDKWSADSKISGDNNLRAVIYVKTSMGITSITSEWIPFHYSYVSGVS